jgi:polar amino acid transport system ATP-binding protein
MSIRVAGIVKTYGPRTVLDRISFEAAKGEALALVGPSGGGKSTMLRCMVGLEPFDEGSIEVAGVNVPAGPFTRHARARSLLHQRAGMVFQQWHLFPHMSALENVALAPIHARKDSPAKAREQAELLLARVGLSHRAAAMPRSMSGGEQQRCAIARALAMSPSVLFMDEPTSALDPQRVGDLVELLTDLVRERELTLVMVTHDMRFALEMATRALVLYEGRVIEDGAPQEVLVSPSDARARAFLGLM